MVSIFELLDYFLKMNFKQIFGIFIFLKDSFRIQVMFLIGFQIIGNKENILSFENFDKFFLYLLRIF